MPDYLAQFEGLVHLVIDAKRPAISMKLGEQTVTDRSYVGQVHSYAAHREVQAPYFLVSNGQSSAVYETSRKDFEPVLLLGQEEIEERFVELEDLVSKWSLCRLVSQRLPLCWSVAIRHREVGFQPMNIAVGDINQDGMPEIAIALSEEHIPIVNHRGDLTASIETDGWVWWVKNTDATGPQEATLVAIQHRGGPLDTSGKLLGINGSRVLWTHPLPRAGSGFEELDRIVIDHAHGALVFGVACDNVISSLSLRGKVLWSTRISAETAWASVMHLRTFRNGRSVLVTSGRQSSGVIVELDAVGGEIRKAVKLPFRGAQIEFLDSVGSRLIVGSADTPQAAIIEWTSGGFAVVDLPFAMRNPRLAVNPEGNLIAISGMGALHGFRTAELRFHLPEAVWSTNEVHGYINRLSWIQTRKGSRILAATCGSASRPRYNGIYLLTGTGELESFYHLSTASVVGAGDLDPAGVRDVRAAYLSSPQSLDLVAIADDSRLYVWNPG